MLTGINLKTLAIIAVVAILALLVDDFINFMQGNDSVIGTLLANAGVDVDKFRQNILKIWENIKTALAGIWQGIKNVAIPVFQSIWSAIKTVFTAIGNVIRPSPRSLRTSSTAWPTATWTLNSGSSLAKRLR